MMSEPFFPKRPNVNPQIYAYEDDNPKYKGYLKIGYTTVNVQKRVADQYPTARPGQLPYKIVFEEQALYDDGTAFTDHDIHHYLRKQGFKNPGKTEWFQCTVDDVKASVIAIRNHTSNVEARTQTFTMRPEQEAAVERTMSYFNSFKNDKTNIPHFLWNAKMRFGKTFTAYQLAKKMGFKRILVLTFKPAVQSAWEEDLKTHVDFEGWQFISRISELTFETADHKRPIVCFGSFQDYLGKNSAGGIKPRNKWVHEINWDMVIFDEYHYGAWRESAKDLFEAEDNNERKYANGEGMDYFEEDNMPITTSCYLYLSGTPFRAITSGEFIEEQIYNWTYSDEQNAKNKCKEINNPYIELPRMVLLTYQLPDAIREIAMCGEFNEFDLNVFFKAEGEGDKAKFKYEDDVQKWLDLIRGNYMETTVDNLKMGAKKPPMDLSRKVQSTNSKYFKLSSYNIC